MRVSCSRRGFARTADRQPSAPRLPLLNVSIYLVIGCLLSSNGHVFARRTTRDVFSNSKPATFSRWKRILDVPAPPAAALELKHDESGRFDDSSADEEDDRDLRGIAREYIFQPRGGNHKKKKSSSSDSSKSKKSKSSSSFDKSERMKRKKKRHKRRKSRDDRKKKRRKRRKKSDSSDSKSKSKKSSSSDHKSGGSKHKSKSKKSSDQKNKSGGSKHKSSDTKKKSDTKSKKSQDKKSRDSDDDDKSRAKSKTKKKSVSKTDVHPDLRLCNTSKERKCRDDCFKEDSCRSGNHVLTPCHKKCRYKCCDPDSKSKSDDDDDDSKSKEKDGTMAGTLCSTSEEKMCRLKCFEKKSCDSEDCQKRCRMDCCSSKSKKKTKDSDDDSKTKTKDSDDDKDSDKESKDDDDSDDDRGNKYKPLKWSGLPGDCDDDVDKYNECYEKNQGGKCDDYDASKELEDIYEAVSNNDLEFDACEDWYSFVCSFREDTKCCRNQIRQLGQCLGKEAFGHDSDDCDDSCKSSGGGDDDTIVQLAIGADRDFSTLVEILTDLDLVDVLSGDGPFTVFAPTNDAFDDLIATLPEDGTGSLDDLTESGLLRQIIIYHVIDGSTRLSSDLSDGDRFKTLQGERIDITIDDGDVKINGDSIVNIPDIEGSNGVIHGISKVLIPPSFLENDDLRADRYTPLEWDDIPRDCRGDVEDFNSCYDQKFIPGSGCFDFDATREIDELRSISDRADDTYDECEEWYGLVCSIRKVAADCCNSEIQRIGNCLGNDVWNHDEDDCSFECEISSSDPSDSYNPLSVDDAPQDCRRDVENFNDCYEANSERDGDACYNYDAQNELNTLFEVTDKDNSAFVDYDRCEDYLSLACSFRENNADCCVDEISDLEGCLGEEAYGFDTGSCDFTCRTSSNNNGPSPTPSPDLFSGDLDVPFRFNINTSPRITGSDIMRARDNTIKEDLEGGLALLVPEIVDETFDTFRHLRLRHLTASFERMLTVRYNSRDAPEITDVTDIDCPLGTNLDEGTGCRKVEAEVTLEVEDEDENSVKRRFSAKMAEAIDRGRLESKIRQFNPDFGKEPERVEPPEVRSTDGDSLSTGQIAGIAVGAFFGVLLIGVLVNGLAKRRRSQETRYDPSESQYSPDSQRYTDQVDPQYEEPSQYSEMPGPEPDETQQSTTASRGRGPVDLDAYEDGAYDNEQAFQDEDQRIQYDGGGFDDGDGGDHYDPEDYR